MITKTTPLSMAESMGYLGEENEKNDEMRKFIKKFVKIKPEKAKEMRKKLESLDLIKVKSEQIVKIIDILPEDSESLNKIFNDMSLDEDESKKILETIKEFQ